MKYTEQFNRTIYNSDGYRQVHEYSGWFHPGTARPLLGPATNQLWRTSLLAAACARHGVMGVSSASVVVMCLGEDPDAARALAGLSAALRDPQDHCRIVSPRVAGRRGARRAGPAGGVGATRSPTRYLGPRRSTPSCPTRTPSTLEL